MTFFSDTHWNRHRRHAHRTLGFLVVLWTLNAAVIPAVLPPTVDGLPDPPLYTPEPAPQDTTRRGLQPLSDTSLTRRPDSLGRMQDSLALRKPDSLRQKPDSLRSLIDDTTYVVYMDSTARLRQFAVVRRDRRVTSLFPERTYPLYGQVRSQGLRREAGIDSTGEFMTFRETIGGAETRVPVQVPLKEYVVRRQQREWRRMLAEEARKPKALVAKDDLGDLLSTITQIQIPLPANPLFSIFGKQEIRLNISGAVDIKAGFRNTQTDQTTISRLDQTRNEPDFSQEVQVNVNGTIGDKLNILADWNTRRTFEYENQLKIKYTGYDDEIVQSIEAGNVSLQTPSSFIGSSQALFGVKARFQMGPLTLTALASQKKGQIKEVAVSGGAKEQTFEFRAYEYSTNHYFIDTSYIKEYEPYYIEDQPVVNPNVQVVEEEVWVQRQGSIPNENERQGIAYITLDQFTTGYDSIMRYATDIPGLIETGPFIKLDRSQYELAGDGYIGVLSLNTNVGDQQIVGIAYRTADGRQYGEFARDLGLDSVALKRPLILKMVKPKNLISNGPSYPVAWRQLLKNIYPIPGIGRNLKKTGFTLDVYRRIPGGEDQNSILNEPLLRVLLVDRYNADDTPAPNGDGQFDYRPRRSISEARAEVIFPTLRPFDTGVQEYFAAKGTILSDTSEYLYPEVYDTTQTFAQQALRNRYIIRGKATGEATSRYSLGFNVVEGSVQVLLDGRQLVQNIDYTVDYIIGEVVIKNDRALVPGANLQIKYEQNDLFQLASKTLLGARGDLALSQKTNFGFTIMNLNQQSLSDKVRLNEEPNTNTIFGVDGSTSLDLPFLTRALDALPLLETRELSSLKISGEAAYMLPDPNTRKSPIPADGGEGIAYIDDFEGARKTTPLGITFAAWTLGSPPADNVYFAGIPDTTKAFSRGRMTWFNRLPTDVKLTDIYPQKRPGSTANNLATVMDIQFAPQTRGQYNYSVDLENTLTRSRNWGFIQKPISISAINLTKENIEFLEIWMRVDQAPADPSAKLIVDLGVISEDVIPNRILNSEDLVLSSYPNGVLQEGEDTGLDMLPDAIERDRYAAMIAKYPDMAGDPSGDNYSFNNATVGTLAEDFTRINGSEANRDGPAGRIPDTEDINLNGIVDLANSYFQFEIPLDTTGGQGGQNPYIVGGGNMGWYQFRVPLKDFLRRVGSPSAENIEFVRLGFSNISDSVHLRIAEINLAGNQWQKLQTGYDTTFAVTVVNIEENPQYTSPPGVIRERDKTRPEEEVYANEQSLAIIVNDLPDGESRQVQKFYTYRALDVFNYKTMKMFVHGDEAFQYVDETNYDAEVFFRFGLDSLNFYEYRAPLRHGWDPMNDITINFADVTALKQARDSVNVISDPVPVQGGPPGAVYRVLGRPSLTQIVYLSIGVENPRGKGTTRPLRGQVWANELRVVSVDDTPGWAYRFDTQLRFADLGAVSFNFSRVDPYFHALEQRFGSRQMSTTWALNASTQLERLLPADWGGTSIPFSYSHTEGFIQPKYLPNSDVLVSEAAEQTRAKILSDGGTEEEANAEADRILSEAETRRTSDTYAAPNFRIVLPTSWWLIRDTFNKLTYGFTYTEANERSPAVVYRRNWSWNARMGYALTLPPDYFLQPFRIFEGIWLLDEYKDFKLFFPITGFNASVGSIRSRDVSMQRTSGAREIITRNFSATRQFGLGWKLTEGGLLNLMGDYNVQIASSLLGLETDSLGQQRPFSEILGDIFLSDGIVNFGEDTQLQQRTTFGTKPNIPNIFGLKKYFDLSLAYSSDYSWQNSLTRGDLGKSSGWNSSINFSTNLRLKQLFDPLFESSPAAPAQPAGRGRRGEAPQPGTQTEHDTTETDTGPSGLGKVGQQLGTLVRVFIKIPFLDYDNINVTFTQSNSVQNTGVVGDNGMGNFWTLSSSTPERGPSRLYQLGLISDPSGSLTNFGFRSSFPFIGADVTRGPRAAGGVLLNSFRQQNRVGIKTSRGLWEGARLDMSWNLGWSYNRTENIVGDSLTGTVTVLNTTSSRSLDRSFMSFPDVFIFGVFNTGIEAVSKKYAELKSDKGDTRSDEEKLSQAFEDGFESIPWLKDVFGEFYPRLNWSLRWDGLEKLPLFSSFTQRLSLDHAYTSGYTRQYQNRPGSGGERTEGQRVNYGFTPLVGLNFQFKELWKGTFGSNFRYSSTTSYDLSTSSRNIVEAISQEMSITASYARRGFEIPFFGLALNNDIDISFSYAMTRTSRKTYDVSKIDINVTGTPLEGSTRTVMEPRIKYVLSQRVTASVYYRHSKIEPDDFGSRIPGSTTNEAGLDIHIAIQ